MSFFRLAIPTTALFLCSCYPAAFPRTGEVVGHGQITGAVAMQVVSWEPQKVELADGRKGASQVAWFPVISGAARVGLWGCEVGGVYQITRIGGETRCGLVQERLGHPLSIALGGMMALDYGPYTGIFGRVGLDVSKRLGSSIVPFVDLYLSSGDAMRYIEDPYDPPPEGPTGGSKSIVRRETRLTVPFGIAIRLAQTGNNGGDDRHAPWIWLVVGATPWTNLHEGPCQDKSCSAKSWDANHGMGFTAGVEIR